MTITEADLFEGGDATVKYHLRAIDFGLAKQMQAMTSDGVDRLMSFLEACLVSWDGVEADGLPAPCDATHKAMLDTEVADALASRLWTMRAERDAARAKSFRDASTLR